jgi:hypothetical protein
MLLFCSSALWAQEPRYGGIISNHPVKSSQVLGIELTWLGMRAAGNTLIVVRYQETCDNGTVITFPDPRSGFLVNDTQTNNAAFLFGGTGMFFPCNGWLNWASMLVLSPNTITPGELMAQLEIHNSMPIGWNVAAPVGNGTGTGTTVIQSILTGTIEEVLYSCSIVSGYVTSWPSATGCSGNPAATDPGTVQNINVANPAAATNWQLGTGPINGQNQVSIINITYTLTTSATAGNRFACVQFMTGGVSGTIVGGPFCATYAQQPSQVVTYNFAAGIGGLTNCSFIGPTQTAVKCPSVPVPLPLYWEANGLLDNFAIDSFVASEVSATTNGFQAGDQLSGINIRVRVKHAND